MRIGEMKFQHFLALVLVSILLTSCLLDVEHQIIPDEKFDERLIGVWTCIPLHDTEEEEQAASEEESNRNDDDIGFNGYLIFGDTGENSMEVVAIEDFDAKHGTMIFKFRDARTRIHGERNYLLFNMETEEEAKQPDPEKRKRAHFVVEYAILKDDSLRLWYYDAGFFLDEGKKTHPIKFHVAKNEDGELSLFKGVTLQGSSEELLKFYSDPEIAKTMVSAGKYKKLPVPENARVKWKPESESE